jgi:hypothetical protein
MWKGESTLDLVAIVCVFEKKRISYQNKNKMKKDEQWLEKKLNKRG